MSTEFKFEKKTRTMADRIKEASAGVGEGNTIKDNGVFRTIATADGRDVDRMIEDDKYRSDYAVANHLAHGEIATEYMAKNPDVATISGSFELGRHTQESSYERFARVPNRIRDKETGNFTVDGDKDLFGGSVFKYKVRGSQNSSSEVKAVREHLQDMGKAAFSS